MNKLYFEHFKQAFVIVYQSFSDSPIETDDVKTLQNNFLVKDITAVIGIIGSFKGQVYLSMSTQTGQAIASAMLGGMDIDETNELVESAIGELTNMIMGNVCSMLSEKDIMLDITPPTVVVGEKVIFSNTMHTYNIAVHCGEYGTVDLDIAVKEE